MKSKLLLPFFLFSFFFSASLANAQVAEGQSVGQEGITLANSNAVAQVTTEGTVFTFPSGKKILVRNTGEVQVFFPDDLEGAGLGVGTPIAVDDLSPSEKEAVGRQLTSAFLVLSDSFDQGIVEGVESSDVDAAGSFILDEAPGLELPENVQEGVSTRVQEAREAQDAPQGPTPTPTPPSPVFDDVDDADDVQVTDPVEIDNAPSPTPVTPPAPPAPYFAP